MSPIKRILDYRLDIHEEFQGWILAFATLTVVFFFCLPCYCAGLSYAPARRFAAWLSQRLPSFYLGMMAFNAIFLFLVVQWLPDWTFEQYLLMVVKKFAGLMKATLECATSIAVIAAFVIALAFKDRIAQLFGFDHKTLFRFKVRDCLTCFGSTRFKPIELQIWKVEDLVSADPFSSNNVFVEFILGYNEPMVTRVHNNAGSGCFIKDHIQLNFDEDDEEETLFIFVRNQKVMGTSELARAEIPSERLRAFVRKSLHVGQLRWTEECFGDPIPLMPRGKLWLRACPIQDEENQSLIQELTSC